MHRHPHAIEPTALRFFWIRYTMPNGRKTKHGPFTLAEVGESTTSNVPAGWHREVTSL